jgi:YidC/Oxa1 family membrane protein insertase
MNTRTFFILVLGILSFLLFMEWQAQYTQPQQTFTEPASDPFSTELEPATTAPPASDLPDLPSLADAPVSQQPVPAEPSEVRASRRIEVVTDVLRVDLDANGGMLVDLRLKQYPVAVDQPDEPFTLLVEQLPELYVAQAGLLADGMPAPNHTSRWEFERDYYELADGSDRLEVPLIWRHESGLEVVATWVFYRGDYVVDLNVEIRNQTGTEWRGARYVQLQRTEPDYSDAGPAFTNPERFSYNGAAWFSPGEGMRKLSFEDIQSAQNTGTFEGGWAAFIQHYFLAAWIPPADQVHRYTTRHVSTDRLPRYVVAATSPQVSVPSGTSHTFTAQLYAGPKLQNRLDEIADGLVLTVDYRFFRILAQPLFWVLDKIHLVINHWGWSIVILTLLIKLIFYKLTEAQFRSMGKMRKLQPRIQQLKERYGDDRQKFGQAMMDIYKKEKVNPLGGCLPILVQIPIFISLYWVLLESVELRQTSFLWVPDLSRPDPYFILPVLNGAFMIITQRLMPTAGMDPLQAKIMMWLPVVFAFMFALFPAGLVLYWATNAGVSLAQQWYILKRLEREA